jgi:hypothetical protein
VHDVRGLLQAALATMQGASRTLRDNTRVGSKETNTFEHKLRVKQQANGEK